MDIDLSDLRKQTLLYVKMLEDLPARSHSWEITTHLQQIIKDTLAIIPFIESMRSESFRDRHWKQLLRLAGMIICTYNGSYEGFNWGLRSRCAACQCHKPQSNHASRNAGIKDTTRSVDYSVHCWCCAEGYIPWGLSAFVVLYVLKCLTLTS